ncbi:putative glycolipid-binding domain-containing protein [Chryseobacterium flavum]|uniref:putative glycolipid-binding domain-containing protein n=1 Tax=Chryseobacterium flavum TaxID=415851 RepID=UPI0028AB2AFE|nr:putative glycolipid-binding domain-containing protein [Chryseobacterium flavum]
MNTLIWKGIFYQSLEYFTIKQENENHIAGSKIIGCTKDHIYSVQYHLVIDRDWLIQKFIIESEVNGIYNELKGEKIQGEWKINSNINPDFKDFKFIDISLTPFTNTLPVNHLKMSQNDSREIKVIYIDVLNCQVKPAAQQYTRTASHEYLYENIQTAFKAGILIDDMGLVIHYPGLFEKISEVNYPGPDY